MEAVSRRTSSDASTRQQQLRKEWCGAGYFQMPLQYPKYAKADYETMPEWKLDCLLTEYGMPVNGADLAQKRSSAMAAFLWPN